MELKLLSLITFFVYALTASGQILQVLGKCTISKSKLMYIVSISLILHGFLIYIWIDKSGHGQNLATANILSFMAWTVTLLTFLSCFKKPLENLNIIILPLCSISIIYAQFYSTPNQVSKLTMFEIIHIFISIIALSILFMAFMQSVLLRLQIYMLRRNNINGIIQFLPPMDKMEQLLYKIITLGFVMFIITISSAFLTLDNISNTKIKTTFSIFGLIVFSSLLYGHYKWGWRKEKIVNYNIVGLSLLAFAYLAPKFYLQ